MEGLHLPRRGTDAIGSQDQNGNEVGRSLPPRHAGRLFPSRRGEDPLSTGGASTIRIGTRGSRLALVQADLVADKLRAAHRGLEVERVVVQTVGDKILDTALSKIGDKGLFTKELESALLDHRVDLAVHSLKDVPTRIAPGLGLGAILEREDPSDALVSPWGTHFEELPPGARVGTSSLRRRSQILGLRPDLEVVDLRGNVPTRIERAERGEYDAVVLARAGIVRLGLASMITEILGPDRILPAVGQGAIAVEIRQEDARVRSIVSVLDDRPTRLAVTSERALLARLEGGCQVPIGALARLDGETLTLDGCVADLDGQTIHRTREVGRCTSEAEAAAIGDRLAARLLDMGAREILGRIFAEARGAAQPTKVDEP